MYTLQNLEIKPSKLFYYSLSFFKWTDLSFVVAIQFPTKIDDTLRVVKHRKPKYNLKTFNYYFNIPILNDYLHQLCWM